MKHGASAINKIWLIITLFYSVKVHVIIIDINMKHESLTLK